MGDPVKRDQLPGDRPDFELDMLDDGFSVPLPGDPLPVRRAPIPGGAVDNDTDDAGIVIPPGIPSDL